MLTPSERQTIQEVLAACNLHYKTCKKVRPYVSASVGNLHQSMADDVIEGLGISVDKLECLLNEPKFNSKVNNAVFKYIHERRMEALTSSRIDEALRVVEKANFHRKPAKAALEDWIDNSYRNIVSMRVLARPIPAVIADANDLDCLLQAIRIVRDALTINAA